MGFTIIVSGDRDWQDIETVVSVLESIPVEFNVEPCHVTLVHGAMRGLDVIAGVVGATLGFKVVEYPYFGHLGKAGGPARNVHMAKQHPDASLVIAFHDDLDGRSRGTKHMARTVTPKYLPNAIFKHVTSRGFNATSRL